MREVSEDLFDTMAAFQSRHGWGRAIAAPQIGVFKRLVCMNVDKPIAFVNPVLSEPSTETVDVWEDCMSFPELLVRIRNPIAITLQYEDFEGRNFICRLEHDYAQLLIHEIDHLDGKLATDRGVGSHPLALRATHPPKDLSWKGNFSPRLAPIHS